MSERALGKLRVESRKFRAALVGKAKLVGEEFDPIHPLKSVTAPMTAWDEAWVASAVEPPESPGDRVCPLCQRRCQATEDCGRSKELRPAGKIEAGQKWSSTAPRGAITRFLEFGWANYFQWLGRFF